MPANTLRIGSISAERLSGVSPNSISEQCKVVVRPQYLSAGIFEESYALSGFDYVNGTGVIGEVLNPEVDHSMSTGVFLISPDQTSDILNALARVHKDEDGLLNKVEITLPYTIDGTVAKIESVKVHSTDNLVADRMENMIGPHQVVAGNTLPTEVCQAFQTSSEVTTATVTIPDASVSSPTLTIDITEFMKNGGSATTAHDLAIGLYLEVEVVDTTGSGPDPDTKVTFHGSQAEILFQYSQEPKILPIAEFSTRGAKRYRVLDDAASNMILTVNQDTFVMSLEIGHNVDCAEVRPPFFTQEFGEASIDWGNGAAPLVDITAEIVFPKTRGKAPQAYFTGTQSGTTISLSQTGFTSWPTTDWHQPAIVKSKSDGLTIMDITDPGYDPSTALLRYDTGDLPQVYTATGRPKAVGVDLQGIKTVTTLLMSNGQTTQDEYGTQTVTINLG